MPTKVAVSDHAQDLLARILVSDQNKRITLSQIAKHPFMTDPFIPETFTKELLFSTKKFNKFVS